MIERRSGTVINIGSALGLVTLPFTGARAGRGAVAVERPQPPRRQRLGRRLPRERAALRRPACLRPRPAGVYSGSKRAVRGLTDALRVELFNSGVDVVYCAPGWVRSNISSASARDNLNQIDPQGPWAPCSRVVTDDLFEAEGRAAVTPARFAKDFVTMALRRHPPGFWSNGIMDG
jgi:short-subunit dehydrogenase